MHHHEIETSDAHVHVLHEKAIAAIEQMKV
jgi:hypothetical protein